MSEKTESKNPIQVADRLFLVLETLAETGHSGLIDLSARLDLHKSTVHRLLTSLIYLGYVKQDGENGRYSLTFKIMELSNKMMGKLDILETVRPYLKKLMEQTGETVHFVQLEGNEAVYIDKVEAYQNSIRMVSKVGNHIPLYCSGVGKAIAANMKEEELLAIWKATDIHSLTPFTIVNYSDFLSELEIIRQRGYALDNEENEIGVRCIASSLPRCQNNLRYAFSISAPVNRMTDDKIELYSQYVLELREQLGRALS